ncbi:MAG: sporulation transcriptional regulator SpoIIID [Clostridia bacterium]|nr:sporulation transcriptional regulator SpoIIID [Clostridia bacterium]
MNDEIRERVIAVAEYIAETGATVRAAAEKFSYSKSTVHKDVSERVKYFDEGLYSAVRKVLDVNLKERHLRGGEATKRKYGNSLDKKTNG